MKCKRRIVASVLASVLLFSVCSTGCNKKDVVKKSAVFVDENTDWFDVTKYSVGVEYNRDDFIFFDQSIIGKYGDMYVFKTEGLTKDYLDADFGGRFLNLDFYSKDGSMVKSIDMMKLASNQQELEKAESFLMNSLYIENGEINIAVDAVFFDEKLGFSEENYECVFDFESEAIEDVKLQPDNMYAAFSGGTYNVGDGFTITRFFDFQGANGTLNVLHVTCPDGVDEDIILDNVFSDLDSCSVNCVIGMDDSTALVGMTDNNSYQHMWATIDLSSAKCEKYDGDMEWIGALNPECMTYITGQGLYSLDAEGVKKVDFDSQEVELVVDFNECNINRFDIPYMRIYSVSDDEVLLAGSVYRNATGVSEETCSYIYEISKCDTNPNVGKEIITLASTRDMNEAVAQAVFEFNKNSEDSLIVFDNSYSLTKYLYEHSNESTGDLKFDTYEAQSKLNAMLTQELMAGEGPDIILDAFDCNMINRTDCLMDLTSYVDKESDLLPNVIKAAKEDDKLYQLPISFGIKGIVTASDLVEKQGFTFEEYSTFVSEACNGLTPMKMDRLDFLDEVLASMNDLIIKHGGDNSIDTKALKVAAEYAKNEVPEFYYDPYARINGATYAEIKGFGNFILGVYTNGDFSLQDLTVVGLPSTDRRGPTIVVDNSLAIAADVNNPDACWSFCQKLLEDEIQEMFFATGTPIKENVLSNMCDKAIDAYNNVRESYIVDGADELMLYQFGMSLPVDNSYTDKYVDIIKSCSVISNSYDSTVKMLIRQEIQPYFADDKTLDEVCKIAQSEIKTYLDEHE